MVPVFVSGLLSPSRLSFYLAGVGFPYYPRSSFPLSLVLLEGSILISHSWSSGSRSGATLFGGFGFYCFGFARSSFIPFFQIFVASVVAFIFYELFCH